MDINKTQKHMLFILGQYYKEIKRKYKVPFLDVAVSKADFIDLAKKSAIVKTKPRAIYRNLENLEKGKLIVYKQRMLKFTPKGKKTFDRINKDIQPYLNVVDKIRRGNIKKSKRAGQMVFIR